MALTVNTNMSALIVKKALAESTNDLNKAIERMTTGSRINHAADDAAGFSIMKNWETKISSLTVASENASTGIDLLKTLEDNLNLISTHYQRIRDLTEQSMNGTYGTESRAAIQSEIQARLDEITRISADTKYNGISLIDGSGSAIVLQVGIDNTDNSRITIAATATAALNHGIIATNCVSSTIATASTALSTIDTAMNNLTQRLTTIGAIQNRLDSAIEAINVRQENLTSSLSTIKDADVATESSNYIKAQILQQAAATLLSTANQAPSIALNLV